MAEAIIEIPEELDGVELDENLLREALDALRKKKAAQAKARERRQKMTPEEKAEAARNAARRRAKIALQVRYAENNGYVPTDDEIDAFIAGQA